MQVSVETTSGLERRLTIGVPSIQVESEVQKRLDQASKTVRINGFRKGKVPMKVVKERYGASVRQEVVGEVISNSFQQAVQKQNLKPAGQPSIEPKQLAEGKDLVYVAVFEVYPVVELSDFSKVEVTRAATDITADDIAKMIETLRKHQAAWEPVERNAADNDKVNIDFLGTTDGKAFEGGNAKGQELVLGSKSMIEGFESGIVGMSANEEKNISVTFPDDYQSEDLRGVSAEFTITLNSVLEEVLPELKKPFFQKFGLEKGGIKAFEKEVKGNMERELKNALSARLKKQVMDALVELHTVDLPKALIGSEVTVLRNQMMERFGNQKQDFDVKSLLPDTMFEEEAKRRVALGLIVGEVIKIEKIKPDAKSVKLKIEEVAGTYEDPQEVVDYYYSNQKLLLTIESAVLEDQVVDFILQTADITEIASSYDDVMSPDEEK